LCLCVHELCNEVVCLILRPLSPCFVRRQPGQPYEFTAEDLPLYQPQILPSSPELIPLSQENIELVNSPSPTPVLPHKPHHHHHHRHSTSSKNRHGHHHHNGRSSSKRKYRHHSSCTAVSSSNASSSSAFTKVRRLSSILDSPEKHGTRMRRLSPYIHQNVASSSLSPLSSRSKRSRSRNVSVSETPPLSPTQSEGDSSLVVVPQGNIFRTPEKPKKKVMRVKSPAKVLVEPLSSGIRRGKLELDRGNG
jgi:hypothetical protein